MSNITKAIQEIYPDINGGFIYWESKQDGTIFNNPIDGLEWNNTEYTKPSWADIQDKLDSINLQEAKDAKKALVKSNRDKHFGKLLFYKKINEVDLYLKPKPEQNIFMAAGSSAASKEWNPYTIDGEKQRTRVAITKEELCSLSDHYEVRKTNIYNLSNDMCFAIDDLNTVEEVEAYDINEIII